MATLTADMKDMIGHHLGYVATVDDDGNPDIGPKMSTGVLDDSHLFFYERTPRQTYAHLKANGRLVIAVADLATKKGYRFFGPVTLHTDDQIFQDAIAFADAHGLKHPVTVPVMEVHRIDLLDAGPKAGTTIAQD